MESTTQIRTGIQRNEELKKITHIAPVFTWSIFLQR